VTTKIRGIKLVGKQHNINDRTKNNIKVAVPLLRESFQDLDRECLGPIFFPFLSIVVM